MILKREWVSDIGRWMTALGVLLLVAFAGVLVFRGVASRFALEEFEIAQAAAVQEISQVPVELETDGIVDFRRWSKTRVRGYNASLQTGRGQPVAVLTVAGLNLRVPVFAGTDEWALNRGVGWIAGTARPGERGNIGIAGHRDGFFRPLKDIAKGDPIELATVTGSATYTVEEIRIVEPSDVGVLRPRAAPSLTLVTCYPFFFVGRAPRRFIVHARQNLSTANAGRGETK